MEQTWTLGGSYADWTMTVTVTAPAHLEAPDLTSFPDKAFANLGLHFHDAVNLYECRRHQDDDRTSAGIYGSRIY